MRIQLLLLLATSLLAGACARTEPDAPGKAAGRLAEVQLGDALAPLTRYSLEAEDAPDGPVQQLAGPVARDVFVLDGRLHLTSPRDLGTDQVLRFQVSDGRIYSVLLPAALPPRLQRFGPDGSAAPLGPATLEGVDEHLVRRSGTPLIVGWGSIGSEVSRITLSSGGASQDVSDLFRTSGEFTAVPEERLYAFDGALGAGLHRLRFELVDGEVLEVAMVLAAVELRGRLITVYEKPRAASPRMMVAARGLATGVNVAAELKADGQFSFPPLPLDYYELALADGDDRFKGLMYLDFSQQAPAGPVALAIYTPAELASAREEHPEMSVCASDKALREEEARLQTKLVPESGGTMRPIADVERPRR